jgi:ParB family chromosome partitioning protein
MSNKRSPHETVRISDVIVPDGHRKVDQETVSRIAESIRANGLLHPIVVRRRKTVSGLGKVITTEIVLVAGAHRLAAAKLAGLKYIPAVFLKGDDSHARLVTIEENLCRKDLTVLERSDQLAEWMRITKQLEVSGHDVRKPEGGRPEGGNAKLARTWPMSGKTEEAMVTGFALRGGVLRRG